MAGRFGRVGGAIWIFAATGAAAQTTGTPGIMSPPPPQFVSSIGLFGSIGNRGNGPALEAEYRWVPHSRRIDFAVRAGFGDDSTSNGTLKLIGVDTRYAFFHESPEFPVDAALTLGLGARFSRNTDVKLIPLGVTVGRRLTPPSGAVLVTTIMYPKLYFVTGDQKDRLAFNMGVGFNLQFARGFEVRFGGSVGEFGGILLGITLFRPFPPEAPEVSGGGAP